MTSPHWPPAAAATDPAALAATLPAVADPLPAADAPDAALIDADPPGDDLTAAPPIDPHAPIGISPRVDIVFRALFGAPEGMPALLALLNAVLRWPVPLRRLTRLPDAVVPDQNDQKVIVIDVLAEDDEGRTFQVEMQALAEAAFAARALYGLAVLVRDRLRRGKRYTALRPCVAIWLCDEPVLPVSADPEGRPRYRRRYTLADDHDHTELTDLAQLYVVELSRLRAAVAADGAPQGPDLWLHFLAEGERWSRAALAAAAHESPPLEHAMKVLTSYTEDEGLRRAYERAEHRLRVIADREHQAALSAQAKVELEAARLTLAAQEQALAAQEQALAAQEQALAEAAREKAEARARALADMLRAAGLLPPAEEGA